MFLATQVLGLVLSISNAAAVEPGLVLESMSVDAQIEVGLSVVSVQQDFHNPYNKPIEAVYTFPLPPDAAVRQMQLTCGDLVIEGEIMTKQAAAQQYEQARQEGRRAALLEQQRSNVFTQKVAGLCPGETVSVNLEYVHQVDYDESTYTLSIPTTVGGPYFAVPGDLKLPPLKSTDGAPADLSLSVNIAEGQGVESIWSDTHSITIDEDDDETHVSLTEGKTQRDRDFVLSWMLAGKQPRVAVVTSPEIDEEAGYIAVTIEPQILSDVAQQQKRELLFVIDESCSMSGIPFLAAKETVRLAMEQMGPNDTFNLVRFSDGADSLFPAPVPVTEGNVDAAEVWLNDFRGGGTRMDAGIVHSLTMPGDPKALRLVLMLTDGYIGNDAQIFQAVRDNLGDSRLFSLGVGSSVNRMLLEGLAEMGRGTVAYQLPDSSVRDLVDGFYSRIAHPSMTDVTVDFGGLDVYDQYPSVIPDLWAGTPVRVVARYRGGGEHLVTIEGDVRGEPYRLRLPLEEDGSEDHEGVRSLWARSRIHDLTYDRTLDEASRREQITDTALRHHLVSAYTSLVATETTPSTCGPTADSVEVPNLVPQGVQAGGESTAAAPNRSYGSSGQIHYKQRTEIDFEGIDVSGHLVKPQGQILLDRHKASMNPLIRHRQGFDDEISGSAPAPRSAFSDLQFEVSASGEIDPLHDVVTRLMRRYSSQFQQCYAKRLKSVPDLETRIELSWTVEDGEAIDFEIVTGDEPLASCMIDKIERWKWDEYEGEVTRPFIFRQGG